MTMTVYDMISQYGKGKGDAVMWNAVEAVSNFVESESVSESARSELMRQLYSELAGGHYNSDFAKEQIKAMYYTDKNGMKHYAPYWTDDEIQEAYIGKKAQIPASYNVWDFAVTLNMLKSDYFCLLKKWWPEASEDVIDGKLVSMAVAFLNDEDSQYKDTKIWHYFNK